MMKPSFCVLPASASALLRHQRCGFVGQRKRRKTKRSICDGSDTESNALIYLVRSTDRQVRGLSIE